MKWLFVTLFLVSNFVSLAVPILTIDSNNQEINLQKYCSHFEDTSGILTIQSINDIAWESLSNNMAFPVNKNPHWLRFQFKNPYNVSVQKVLFTPYHLISNIQVFSKIGSNINRISIAGINFPYDAKAMETRGYASKISFEPHSVTTIFMRFDYRYRPLRANTFLMSESRTKEVIKNNNTFIWMWKGVFIFAIIVSLVFFWFIKLKMFLYYFLLNIGVYLFLSSQIGDYFLFFNVDSTNITSVIDFTGAILINLFLPRYLNSLTPIKENNSLLWKWMYHFIYLGVFIVAINIFPFIRNSELMFYSHYYIMILTGFVISIQLKFLVKNIVIAKKNAYVTLIIYGIYTIVAFTEAILPNLGVIHESVYVFRVLILSSFFEIFSFMYLMGSESLSIYTERAVLLNAQKKHQKEIIFSMVIGQEEERNRLGIELHDSIGANMAIIKHKANEGNQELLKIIDQTIQDLREISHGLVVKIKKEDSFVNKVNEMCNQFCTESMTFHPYDHKWPKQLNLDLLTHLYRIVQELFQNAAKHSNAKNIHIQLIGHDDYGISVLYEDDGVGFEYDQYHKGLGLNNIKNRVELINGTLKVDSTKGNGTTIIIEIEV